MPKPIKKPPTILRAVAGFLTLLMMFFVLLPSTAMAVDGGGGGGGGSSTTLPPDPCDPGNGGNEALQEALANTGNMRSQAALQLSASIQTIDIQAAYCLSKIQDMFGALTSTLAGLSFNPFNVLLNIVVSQVTSAIITMIASVCQAAIGTISSVANAALSIVNSICIPIPQLNLGLNGLSALQINGMKPCTGGIPLGNLIGSGRYSPAAIPTYDYRSFGR
jgi:hypothetical protein